MDTNEVTQIQINDFAKKVRKATSAECAIIIINGETDQGTEHPRSTAVAVSHELMEAESDDFDREIIARAIMTVGIGLQNILSTSTDAELIIRTPDGDLNFKDAIASVVAKHVDLDKLY